MEATVFSGNYACQKKNNQICDYDIAMYVHNKN